MTNKVYKWYEDNWREHKDRPVIMIHQGNEYIHNSIKFACRSCGERNKSSIETNRVINPMNILCCNCKEPMKITILNLFDN